MSVQFDNIGDLKPKITAGGKDNSKFVPNLNVSFHNDEFYFNLNRKDKIIKNEKTATVRGKTSLGGIDTDIWYIDDKGRLKWDIEFASRPAANSWTWELKHTKGIEFYYQGELTTEEIADGRVRPDEVVGSYAVYCNKVNNKYKTGKLCHIYRPFCYDANGNTIYADLLIADGQLTISINAAWLDSAAYPVRLDPTIGYTTAGGSNLDHSDFICQNPDITMPESGTAYKVWGYFRGNGSAHDSLLGLYADDSGAPGNVIEYNLAVSVTSVSPAWYSYSLSGSSLSSGSKYYPALLCPSDVSGNFMSYNSYYYDSASGTNCYYINGLSAMPSPAGTLLVSSANVSVYLEYTVPSSGGGPLVGASALVGGGVLCGQGNLIN